MSDFAIKVEGLGKKYLIQHQASGRRYATLRDVLAEKAKSLFRTRHSPPVTRHSVEEFWALQDVSFEVKPGEVVGIIGRNGAGKSTLLKLLSRITEPTAGRVRLRGRVASLLEVGTGFHPELTGRENIFLNGAVLGMHRVEIKKKFDEIVAFAEVEKFLDTPVKRYSSGMYMRLAFAVAAHLEPEILIVDEVLAVGDAQFQKKCLGKMQDVAGNGRTVLFVSHNMAAIQQLCGRCVLLRKGTVAADGASGLVTQEYLTDASSGGDGCFDLKSHPARSPMSKAVITELKMLNREGLQASNICPQDEVTFEITIDTPRLIKEPRVAIAIEDHLGRRLMTLASYFEDEALPGLQGKKKLRCQCGPLFLGPGRYLLSVSIGTKLDGLIDSLDGACWFDVLWGNNFKNGETYHSVYGPLLKTSKWESF